MTAHHPADRHGQRGKIFGPVKAVPEALEGRERTPGSEPDDAPGRSGSEDLQGLFDLGPERLHPPVGERSGEESGDFAIAGVVVAPGERDRIEGDPLRGGEPARGPLEDASEGATVHGRAIVPARGDSNWPSRFVFRGFVT